MRRIQMKKMLLLSAVLCFVTASCEAVEGPTRRVSEPVAQLQGKSDAPTLGTPNKLNGAAPKLVPGDNTSPVGKNGVLGKEDATPPADKIAVPGKEDTPPPTDKSGFTDKEGTTLSDGSKETEGCDGETKTGKDGATTCVPKAPSCMVWMGLWPARGSMASGGDWAKLREPIFSGKTPPSYGGQGHYLTESGQGYDPDKKAWWEDHIMFNLYRSKFASIEAEKHDAWYNVLNEEKLPVPFGHIKVWAARAIHPRAPVGVSGRLYLHGGVVQIDRYEWDDSDGRGDHLEQLVARLADQPSQISDSGDADYNGHWFEWGSTSKNYCEIVLPKRTVTVWHKGSKGSNELVVEFRKTTISGRLWVYFPQ